MSPSALARQLSSMLVVAVYMCMAYPVFCSALQQSLHSNRGIRSSCHWTANPDDDSPASAWIGATGQSTLLCCDVSFIRTRAQVVAGYLAHDYTQVRNNTLTHSRENKRAWRYSSDYAGC